MKLLFYILTVPPIEFINFILNIIFSLNFVKSTEAFKVSKVNLKIAYPSLNSIELDKLAIKSVKESIISGFESMYSWSRESNKLLFRIDNNFILQNKKKSNKGLMILSLHNRSVDTLLKWICSFQPTITLYKKVKINFLDSFIKKQRQHNNSQVYETNINGVRQLYKALLKNKVICMAVDQVPQKGMGEYENFFNRPAYTNTLMSSLAVKTNKDAVYCSLNKLSNNRLHVVIKDNNKGLFDSSKCTLSMNLTLEELINNNPSDYCWEYKIYKRPPNGFKDPYKDL